MSDSDEESVNESAEEVSEDENEEVAVAEPVKAKRTRKSKKGKNKDPNKPKRNLTAYFLYSTAVRAEVKKENPELSFGDLAKLIAKKFRSLDDKEKKKWGQKAEKDKIRYLEEMKSYVAPVYSDSDNDTKSKKKKVKKVKDPNKPKRSMSAYFIYSVEKRAEAKQENPDASFGDLAKIIAKKFRELPDKDKKLWETKAAKDKIRYADEMKSYKEKNES